MADGMSRSEAMKMGRAMVGEEEEGGVLVLPRSERPLIRLVLACHNRWQRVHTGVGQSVPVAFDLPAVDIAARWMGITPDAHLMTGLTMVEREALKLMRAER